LFDNTAIRKSKNIFLKSKNIENLLKEYYEKKIEEIKLD